ncbi:MAG: DUF3488 and transglutaminase-like domain-containing protein [Acidimicrobiia bacterium]|nr:DUF3488 and transglutaminase-like domain-containing protein [Acidimicrobiia bacterium]
MTARSRNHIGSPGLLLTELLLLATTASVLLGFTRLFADDSWRRPIFLAALIAHGTALVLRRLPVSAAATVPVHLGIGIVTLSSLFYRSTTNFGFPTRTTLDLARSELDVAFTEFPDAVAPTAALTGFVLLASAAIWVIVLIADTAAFRVKSIVQALLPMVAALVFIAALGDDSQRYELTALAMAAGLAFAIAHRVFVQLDGITWLGSTLEARTAVGRGAAAVAFVAAVFALSTVPLVPDAEQSLVDLDSGSVGDPGRVVISPLVDIRQRIVQQQDVEVFQVRSQERTYYRLTSLDAFDGTVWRSRADYSGADGELDATTVSNYRADTVAQHFRIEALAAVWLPAAYQPVRIANVSGADVSWEADSSTLIVDADYQDSDGIEYTIESAVPRFTSGLLTTVGTTVPVDLARFTELPDDFSPTATELAQQIVARHEGPYAQALALQNWFRAEFTYSTDVTAGHSSDRIEDFLTSRIGYCEQFAGSFAAMARSLGIPARVAVGFTPGDFDPADPTLYRVRGEHAHAWPEIYLDGAGWVAFEPTPGRGAPGAEEYTGVPEQQDETGPSEAADPNLSDVLPPFPDPFAGDQAFADPDPLGALAETATGRGAFETTGLDVPWRLIAALTGVIAVVLVGFALVPVIGRRRRRARFDHLDDPRRRHALLAWNHVADVLAPLGLTPAPNETAGEFAARATGRVGARQELERLATLITGARFAADPPDETTIDEIATAVAIIERAVRSRTTRWQRIRAEYDPRRLAAQI